jgi:hypothetical protein
LQKKILTWEKILKPLPVRWILGKNMHITLIPPWYATEAEIKKIKNILKIIYSFFFAVGKILHPDFDNLLGNLISLLGSKFLAVYVTLRAYNAKAECFTSPRGNNVG